jgi:hypothetical protein
MKIQLLYPVVINCNKQIVFVKIVSILIPIEILIAQISTNSLLANKRRQCEG